MLTNAADLEQHRTALTGHCYRMLGSAMDTDDAVQEAMVRAWRSLDRFDGRSSLRTWLCRIATNVCLDALSERSRRVRPVEEGAVGAVDNELVTRPRTHWLEPIPDARALPLDADPSEMLALRQSIRLAFVAALQRLPAKQRAALLLTEVLGCSVAEVAETLDTSIASVNSALQRARATLAAESAYDARPPLTSEQAALVDRYVAAFERYDVDALTALLRKDAVLSMPPYTLWLQGHDSIRRWLLGRGAGCRGSRLLPTSACGSPAFAQYRPAPEGGPPGLGAHRARRLGLGRHGDDVVPRHRGALPPVWAPPRPPRLNRPPVAPRRHPSSAAARQIKALKLFFEATDDSGAETESIATNIRPET